jgi:hypothetical protein
MKKRIISKQFLPVIILVMTVYFGLFVQMASACGAGQRPCGGTCIDRRSECMIDGRGVNFGDADGKFSIFSCDVPETYTSWVDNLTNYPDEVSWIMGFGF